jgi:parallel beta-helix repeat protein
MYSSMNNLVLGILVLFSLIASVHATALPPGTCGSYINSDFVMSSDLDCSGFSSDALHIIADNVVFDCAGHTIFGPGDYNGIHLYNHSGVTIKNCNITNFNVGIEVYEGQNNQILLNTLYQNNYGLDMQYTDFNKVLNNKFIENNYGFYLYEADSNEIGHNQALDSDSWFGIGSGPFLFLWNGSAYDYYTDVAGEPLGIPLFKPQKYESGIYELGAFKPDNGAYKLKLREVIPESDFIDEVKLIAVDVPEGYSVLNKWSYTYLFGQSPEKGFMTVHDPIKPASATDSYGNDVLAQVSEKDGVPVPSYDKTMNPVSLAISGI